MGFGFNRCKKSKAADRSAASNVTTTFDQSGNVEIVSKNFKMKTTQKADEDAEPAGSTWICWGCGQPTSQDICPVCGKKKTK